MAGVYKRASPHLPTQEESNTIHLELYRAATTNYTMRSNTLFFLVVLSGLCLALAQMTYEDCCFKYVKEINHRNQKRAVSYRKQVTDGSCNIPAIIFTMKRGRELCANPREKWVTNLMNTIDKRRKNDPRKLRKFRQL